MWHCCYSLGVLLYTLSSATIIGFEDNKRPVDKLSANTLRKYKWRKKLGSENWQRIQKLTPDQGGITCGAIDEPRKSSKAINERVIINFRDKNVVIARFRDKNVIIARFRDKNV